MNKKRNAILIGAVCFILTLAIAIQMKTIKNSNLVVTETSENTELQNSAIKWKERYEQTISELEKADSLVIYANYISRASNCCRENNSLIINAYSLCT